MTLSNPESRELDMFTFFEMTLDLVCIAGRDGFFRKVNPAVIEKLEYTQEELFASPIASFIYPDDQSLTDHRRTKLLNGEALMNFENRYVTKSGKIVWLAWTSVYFPAKEVVFAIAKDITPRKQIESEIEEKYKKYKSLATHFKSSLEKDRKYIATELHEELAQLAAVIKMDIDWISHNDPDLSSFSRNRMDHASIVTDMMIKTIRRISFSMSPNMIEDVGLNATLEWHCKEFSILNGIPCLFESNFKEEDLSSEIQLDFFRICQEALTNVMNHAQASSVIIRIEDSNHLITLTVTDNGKGFDNNQKKESGGLLSMKKRAASINSLFKINSKIGKGTKVFLQVQK